MYFLSYRYPVSTLSREEAFKEANATPLALVKDNLKKIPYKKRVELLSNSLGQSLHDSSLIQNKKIEKHEDLLVALFQSFSSNVLTGNNYDSLLLTL